MQCPTCSKSLKSAISLKTNIKLCSACRGIWFDPGTLSAYVKALSQNELIQPTKTQLFERRQVDVKTGLNAAGKTCPRCHVTMRVLNYAYDSNVFVDQCPTCHGIWTDQDEIKRIAEYIKPDPKTAAVGQALAEEVHEIHRIQNLPPPGVRTRNSLLRFMFLPKFILPLRDDATCSIFPWATMSLIAACCMVFAGEMLLGQDAEVFLQQFAFVPAHFFSLGLLTSMFLHASLWHLLGNMFFLWLFGDNIEDRLGWGNFLELYLASGLAGSILHTLAYPDSTVPCIGASGAISGIMGAYMIFFPMARIKTYVWGFIWDIPAVFYLLGWLGLQILSSRLTTRTESVSIAWFAHIGGFVCGLLWAVIQTMSDRRSTRTEAGQH
ncbi:MAG: rhomboid family intramembrane serine protease [Phycisphaeraceae bacterium]|nr:rhomboid family intramembrane serine protease [Phycisphaeraceae bacterium]